MSDPVTDLVIEFAASAVVHHVRVCIPYMSMDDARSTRQAAKELLAEVGDVKEFSIFDLHKMANELIEDYMENQEDLGHVRDYPITD